MVSSRVSCPNWQKSGADLLDMSHHNDVKVDYYRCGDCGHVWTTEKGTLSVIGHVTQRKPIRPDAR